MENLNSPYVKELLRKIAALEIKIDNLKLENLELKKCQLEIQKQQIKPDFVQLFFDF